MTRNRVVVLALVVLAFALVPTAAGAACYSYYNSRAAYFPSYGRAYCADTGSGCTECTNYWWDGTNGGGSTCIIDSTGFYSCIDFQIF